MLPDIDLLLQRFIVHHGPTHSFIIALIVFTPFFFLYRKQAIPYFVAYAQHALIGDYIGGGHVQLLWPLTNTYFGAGIQIRSTISVSTELAMFLTAMTLMFLLKDIGTFFQAHKSNLLLIIPGVTCLQIIVPRAVPLPLILPSIFYIGMFTAAVLIQLVRTKAPKTDPTRHAAEKTIV